jgi:hypothetical protein
MQNTRSSLVPAFAILIVWAAIAAWFGQRGTFTTQPGELPLALVAAVIGPPILFGILYGVSAGIRSYALGLDLRFLTAMQAWRIIGGMFLVLMVFRLVPRAFAWPAGVGDMIVGVYAPFVVLALVRRSENWRSQVVLLSVLGLLDFVGAIGSGLLTGNNPLGVFREDVTTAVLQELPLSIIPTFAVPAWIIVHVISLLKIKNSAVAEMVEG